MKRNLLVWAIFIFSSIGSSLGMAQPLQGAAMSRSSLCRNQKMEKEALDLWGQGVRVQMEDLVQRRLLKDGDIYALYDLQIFLQNFLTLTDRCHNTHELSELAKLLLPTAKALAVEGQESRKKWICRGGDICRNNRLLNREVFLVSVQFAGLLASTANAIASLPVREITSDMRLFLETFLPILFEDHLSYWVDLYSDRWSRLAKLPRKDVPANFMNAFDDKDMWLLTVLTEARSAVTKLGLSSPYRPGLALNLKITTMYNKGLAFLQARIDKRTYQSGGMKEVMAFLDLGAWSQYEDMIYAGYTSLEKPLVCEPGGKKVYRVPRNSVPMVATVNMDISHARRYVTLFDSLRRNEGVMLRSGGNPVDSELGAAGLQKAVANSFAEKVMSPILPLFHTYMDGTNGWYRVDYSAGNSCREGDAPYSSSYAGPTGGFAFWADQNPKIGKRMLEIYHLLESTAPADQKMAESYYGNIKRLPLHRFMFVSSLVNIVQTP